MKRQWPEERRGTIGMVRRPDVINDATCQFYIDLAENKTSTTRAKARRNTATGVSARWIREHARSRQNRGRPVEMKGTSKRTPVQPVSDQQAYSSPVSHPVFVNHPDSQHGVFPRTFDYAVVELFSGRH